MKRLLIIALLLCSIAILAQPKRYTVSLTIQEWQTIINQIDSKQVSSILEQQLIPQIKADTLTKTK